MTVLGPAILDNAQQEAIERGAAELKIERYQVFPDAAKLAEVGDFWWVKERCVEVQSGKYNCPSIFHEFVPGSVLGHTKNIPPHLKQWWPALKKEHNRPAKLLQKKESRACLKIFSIEPSGFRCSVYMENVDVFLCRAA